MYPLTISLLRQFSPPPLSPAFPPSSKLPLSTSGTQYRAPRLDSQASVLPCATVNNTASKGTAADSWRHRQVRGGNIKDDKPLNWTLSSDDSPPPLSAKRSNSTRIPVQCNSRHKNSAMSLRRGYIHLYSLNVGKIIKIELYSDLN